jgi:acetoacetyl-CoA synthetase
MTATKLLWEPKNKESTEMIKFKHFINKKFHFNLVDYHQLWKFSVTEIALFWSAVWEYCQIIHSKPYDLVMID